VLIAAIIFVRSRVNCILAHTVSVGTHCRELCKTAVTVSNTEEWLINNVHLLNFSLRYCHKRLLYLQL